MSDFETIARISLTFLLILALICRVGKMSDETSKVVKNQHTILLSILWTSLLFENGLACVLILAGMVSFFGFSISRWKNGDPSIKVPA